MKPPQRALKWRRTHIPRPISGNLRGKLAPQVLNGVRDFHLTRIRYEAAAGIHPFFIQIAFHPMSPSIKPLGILFLIAAAVMRPAVRAQETGVGTPLSRSDLIILDEIGVRNLKLELVETQEAEFEQTIFALGRIEVFPGSLSVVSSRIPGRAHSVLVKADMAVAQGDALLWVESRQPGDPPPMVKIEAPHDGIVARMHVAPGQPIGPDDSLMEIVDLSIVHAVARVPEHFAGRLEVGQIAHIRVSGYPDKTFDATLEHLGALVDAESGTLEAAFHVPNPDKLLRPGMKAEFSIVTDARDGVMAVPREAVQGDGATRFVYIADYELKHAFLKIPVEIGEQNETMIEIVSGLFPGDQVVTRGAYALGFAGKGSVTLKEALDAAHGHPHAADGSELTGEETAIADGGVNQDPLPARSAGFNTLTLFFAGLSALLFVLLLLSIVFRNRATA